MQGLYIDVKLLDGKALKMWKCLEI